MTFIQKMTARIPGLKVYLQAYCTDGEKALRGALGQEFDRSVAFVCKIHEKQNIKDKGSKLQISNAVSKVIVDDIFNSEGLVHASTKRSTGKNSRNSSRSETGWSEREDTRREPQFSSYFSSYKADEILHHVTARVSKEAGFDNEVQCNNVSERGNIVTHQAVLFKSVGVPLRLHVLHSFCYDISSCANLVKITAF